jgi:hypothetical protein
MCLRSNLSLYVQTTREILSSAKFKILLEPNKVICKSFQVKPEKKKEKKKRKKKRPRGQFPAQEQK